MTLPEFLAILKECPLIASVQASPGSPLDDTETLLKLAQASVSQGVRILRLEGVENIKRIRAATGCPTIGLIKRRYPDSELYITPTMREVEELIETGCEVIAIDARRHWNGHEHQELRPNFERITDLIGRCHQAGRLVLADCDNSSLPAVNESRPGWDVVSTTFANARSGLETFARHDFKDLGYLIECSGVPVLAEGNIQTESHIRWAVQMGAKGVVVGGALNDPIKITTRFTKAGSVATTNVGAVDIGGTWIRFGLFSPDWKLLEKRRTKLPPTHAKRLNWINAQAAEFGVDLIGVSTGGMVDPRTGHVEMSTSIIPDNEGAEFEIPGLRLRVLNDGLAATWAHLVHESRTYPYHSPEERTVTIAIGTGLGCGMTSGFGLIEPQSYPRLNDLEFELGNTYEDVLSGQALGASPSSKQKETAIRALSSAIEVFAKLFQPRTLYLCGGVAHSPWMRKDVKELLSKRIFAAEWEGKPGDSCSRNRCDVKFSPFGADAGLYGAAALALFPPVGVFPE